MANTIDSLNLVLLNGGQLIQITLNWRLNLFGMYCFHHMTATIIQSSYHFFPINLTTLLLNIFDLITKMQGRRNIHFMSRGMI